MTGAITFRVLRQDARSRARAGLLSTPHGDVATPAFVPLARHGAADSLTPAQLEEAGTALLRASAVALSLRPGADVVASLGGLHRFMGWLHPSATDVGLGGGEVEVRDVSEEGASFRSLLDGSSHLLTPEGAMEVQHKLGADIMLTMGAPLGARGVTTERGLRWAQRCLQFRQAYPFSGGLFGLVQGGTHQQDWEASASFMANRSMDGFALEAPARGEGVSTLQMLDWAVPRLPLERPRYLLGLTEIESLAEVIARGVDLLDSAIPGQLARRGVLLLRSGEGGGRLYLASTDYALDTRPPEPGCKCPACRSSSRAYLHHLFQVGELAGQRLAMLHNTHVLHGLVRDMRQSILEGRFGQGQRLAPFLMR